MTEQKHNSLLVHTAEAVLELHENLQKIFGNTDLQDENTSSIRRTNHDA